MCVQALYYLQACVITVLVGLIVRYLQHSIFCVYISGAPSTSLDITYVVSFSDSSMSGFDTASTVEFMPLDDDAFEIEVDKAD